MATFSCYHATIVETIRTTDNRIAYSNDTAYDSNSEQYLGHYESTGERTEEAQSFRGSTRDYCRELFDEEIS